MIVLRRFTVLATVPGYVTVDVVGGPPLTVTASPQFTPDVGETVLIPFLDGVVPQSPLPESIAVDAITAREIQAGTITALLIQGDTIQTSDEGGRVTMDAAGLRLYDGDDNLTVDLDTADGSALVTGEYRSAVDGERFTIDGSQVRFYPVTGDAYGSIDVVSYLDSAWLTITTATPPSGFIPLLTLHPLGTELRLYRGVGATLETAGFNCGNGDAIMSARDNTTTPDTTSSVTVTNNSIVMTTTGQTVVSADNTVEIKCNNGVLYDDRMKVDLNGIGFHGTVPIAKPTLAAAATDLPTCITLVNSIRTALRNYGLCS